MQRLTMTATPTGTAFQAPRPLRSAPRHAAVAVRASSEMQKPTLKPTSPEPTSAPQQPAATATGGVVTIEYQRQQAKALQQYFRDLKLEEVVADAQVFGWTKKNEISNGRWVMMGFAVGLLTEYATAVNFVDQIKLMLSYMGIVDLD